MDRQRLPVVRHRLVEVPAPPVHDAELDEGHALADPVADRAAQRQRAPVVVQGVVVAAPAPVHGAEVVQRGALGVRVALLAGGLQRVVVHGQPVVVVRTAVEVARERHPEVGGLPGPALGGGGNRRQRCRFLRSRRRDTIFRSRATIPTGVGEQG